MGLKFFAVAATTKAGYQAAIDAAREAMASGRDLEPGDVLQVLTHPDGTKIIRPCTRPYLIQNALWDVARERSDVEDASFHSGSMMDKEMPDYCRWAVDEIDAGRVGDEISWTVDNASQTGERGLGE